MNPILLSVLIVSAIGLLAGLGLAVASIVMAVPVDEKAEALEAVLPGANCGACGFSGCAGYAKALSEGKTRETALCAPRGQRGGKGNRGDSRPLRRECDSHGRNSAVPWQQHKHRQKI